MWRVHRAGKCYTMQGLSAGHPVSSRNAWPGWIIVESNNNADSITLHNTRAQWWKDNSDIYRKTHITTALKLRCRYLTATPYITVAKLPVLIELITSNKFHLHFKLFLFFPSSSVQHHLSFLLLLCSLNRETEKREGVAWWRLLWDLCGRWGSC